MSAPSERRKQLMEYLAALNKDNRIKQKELRQEARQIKAEFAARRRQVKSKSRKATF